MRIKIDNLGPIREAEMVIRPLTVFVGPNNSGKTWTAYLFAGIIGRYGWYKFAHYYSMIDIAYPLLDEVITDIIEKGNAKMDILDFIEKYGERYLNDVAQLSTKWAGKFMGSNATFLENFVFTIHPDFG